MVFQCAIQMSDIPKDIKKLSNEDCLFIFTNGLRSKKCSHLNYIFSSSDVSLSPFMFERHYIAP